MAKRYFGSIPVANNISTSGVTLLSTNANTVSGTENSTAVTPSGLNAKLNGANTQYAVLLGGGVGVSVQPSNVGTNGMVLISATAGNPQFALITSAGGSIVFSLGANTLNMEASGGGLVWSVITGASQAMVKSNGYFSNRAGSAVAFTLPVSAAVGDTFEVANMGARATGWTIAYGTGQYIRFGNQTTTVTTGSLAATATGDAVRLVCSVANTEFVVTPGSQGNITLV